MMALALRILRQLRRDPRTLGLAFLAPLLLIWLFSLFVQQGTVRYQVGVVGEAPPGLRAMLSRQDLDMQGYGSIARALSALRADKVEALLLFQGGSATLWIQGADPLRAQTVRQRLVGVFRAPTQSAMPVPRVRYLYGGPNLGTLSYFLPALLGFFLFFFAYLLSGITFLRERTQGTLERLLRTPLRAGAIVGGYFLAFGLIALVQAGLVLWLVFGPLGAAEQGPMWLIGLVALLIALGGVVLGLLLSAAARTEFQVVQFIPVVIIPQVLFSGIFPLDALPRWLQDLGTVMPMTYAVDAIRRVAIEGRGLSALDVDLGVLIGFVLVVGGLNAFLLGRRRMA